MERATWGRTSELVLPGLAPGGVGFMPGNSGADDPPGRRIGAGGPPGGGGVLPGSWRIGVGAGPGGGLGVGASRESGGSVGRSAFGSAMIAWKLVVAPGGSV